MLTCTYRDFTVLPEDYQQALRDQDSGIACGQPAADLDSGCGPASDSQRRDRPQRKDSEHNKISKQAEPSLYQTRGGAPAPARRSHPAAHQAGHDGGPSERCCSRRSPSFVG